MKRNLTNHPQIQSVLELYHQEQHPFVKIHRMIDLFETIIKTHTAVIISDYFRLNHVSEDIKRLLAEGLRTPSLGLWQVFNRLIIEDLTINKQLTQKQFQQISSSLTGETLQKFSSLYSRRGEGYFLTNPVQKEDRTFLKNLYIQAKYAYSENMFIPNFIPYFYQWDQMISQSMKSPAGPIPDIVNFRNKYAHGATPDQQTCEKDIERYTPVLEKLLAADWLTSTGIAVFQKKDGKIHHIFESDHFAPETIKHRENVKLNQPYLYNEKGELLNLFPIMTFKELPIENENVPTLLFLNDLKKIKKKKISLLNYPYAYHVSDDQIYEDFISILNVIDWKKRDTHIFSDYIEELVESFQGRIEEQEKIKHFIDTKTSGFLFLFGNPGIGKSALLAKIIKDYKYSANNESNKPYTFVEYFIRRNSSSIERFLDSLNLQLESAFLTKIPIGGTIEEKHSNLHDRLHHISQQSKNGKIIICIDGLDEGIQGQLISYINTQTYQNILFIYSSRPVEKVEQLYQVIHPLDKQKFSISGLSTEEIRGLLFKVTNKYEIIGYPDYIKTILEKSKGNPLYLKLLCSEIEMNNHSLYQIDQLPSKIEDFYDEIMARFRKEHGGNEVLSTVYVLAKAKDFLSTKHLQFITGFTDIVIDEVIATLQEVLIENPNESYSYQLFHDSFREYLEVKKKDNLVEAEIQIVEFCAQWKSLNYYSDSIRMYPMKYYSSHLVSLDDQEQLVRLAADQEYIKAQYLWTSQYLYTIHLFLDGMQITTDSNGKMDYAVRIAELHNQITSNVSLIVNPVQFSDSKQMENLLKQITAYKGAEQFILYIILLHQTLNQALLGKQKRKEFLQMIIEHLDEHTDSNVIGYKWCDFFSISYLVTLLAQLKDIGCNLDPILIRSDLQNIDNEYVEYELKYFNLQDPIYYSIISGLFLTQPYDPVVKSFVTLLCQQQLFSKALEIADQIPTLSIKVLSKVEVARAYYHSGKKGEALDLINEIYSLVPKIREDALKVQALCSIVNVLVEMKEKEKASLWLKEAEEITVTIKDTREQSFAWRELAIYEGKQNNFDHALAMIKTNVKDTWNQIIALCSLILDMKDSGKDFDEVLAFTFETLKQSVDYRDKRSSIRSIAVTLNKLGRHREAYEWLLEAKDHWNSLYILRSIGVELARRNLVGEMKNYVDKLTDVFEQALVIGTFISEETKPNGMNKALELYKEFINSTRMKKIGLQHLSTANVQSSTIQQEPNNYTQQDCLERVKKLNELTDDYLKSLGIAHVATDFYRLGDDQKTQTLMSQAVETALRIENSYNRSFAVSEVAKEYSKQNEMNKALEMVKDIEYLWNVTALMRQIAHNLTLTRQYEPLFTLIKEQKEKNLILVMVDEMLRMVNKENLYQVINFIQNDIISEVIKTHAYDQILSILKDYKEDILEVLIKIIPQISYNRLLICKSIVLYALYLRDYSGESTEFVEQKLKNVVDVIDLSEFSTSTFTFSFNTKEEWLKTITDEDDLLFIKSLIRQVDRKKITKEQFQEMAADVIG
ncbi:hypothetical protein [Neobacillus niacini]|uniref:hypothetical protein n=1 Tax=Neobacillus niacini TaxID=86668 RepID=UPI003982EEBA